MASAVAASFEPPRECFRTGLCGITAVAQGLGPALIPDEGPISHHAKRGASQMGVLLIISGITAAAPRTAERRSGLSRRDRMAPESLAQSDHQSGAGGQSGCEEQRDRCLTTSRKGRERAVQQGAPASGPQRSSGTPSEGCAMCAGVSPAAEAGLVGARHVRVAARLLPECDDPFRVRAPRDPLDRSTQCLCRIKLSALWVPGVCKGSIAFVSRENLRARMDFRESITDAQASPRGPRPPCGTRNAQRRAD